MNSVHTLVLCSESPNVRSRNDRLSGTAHAHHSLELVILCTVNNKRSAINCRYVSLAVVTFWLFDIRVLCAARSARVAVKLCKSACGGLSRRLCRTLSVLNVSWQTTGAC